MLRPAPRSSSCSSRDHGRSAARASPAASAAGRKHGLERPTDNFIATRLLCTIQVGIVRSYLRAASEDCNPMSSGCIWPGVLRLAACCLIAVTTPMLFAQAASWPLGGPAFSASPGEISAAAAKIPPEKFADATVLFEEEKYQLDAAGRLTTHHRFIYRIETAAG